MKVFQIIIISLVSSFLLPAKNKLNTDSLLVAAQSKYNDTSKINTMVLLCKALKFDGKIDIALQFGLKALHLTDSLGWKKGKVKALLVTGAVYSEKGDFPKAISNYFEALKISSQINNAKLKADSFYSISLFYYGQDNSTEALKNNDSSFAIRENLKDKGGLGACYNLYGIIYAIMAKNELALENHFKALAIRKESGDLLAAGSSLQNIGNIFYQQKKYNDAIQHYKEALTTYEEFGDKQGASSVSGILGFTLLEKKDIQGAEKYIRKALELSKEIGWKPATAGWYNYLVQVDEAKNDYKNAYQHYKLQILYNDSLQSEENIKKQTEAEMKFIFEKKQTADSLRNMAVTNEEAVKHEQKIKQQRMYTYIGIVGFVLMIVVASVSFRAYKQKQKANHIITEQKAIVDEKQKEILDSIHYAKRIQNALLTNEKYIEKSIERLTKK